ncbi:hypothetical protein J6590_042154 [Homalodisca vitripennis]|nr:hypothetical protein J6590_042154 [Homalodisca vitripennis]
MKCGVLGLHACPGDFILPYFRSSRAVGLSGRIDDGEMYRMATSAGSIGTITERLIRHRPHHSRDGRVSDCEYRPSRVIPPAYRLAQLFIQAYSSSIADLCSSRFLYTWCLRPRCWNFWIQSVSAF